MLVNQLTEITHNADVNYLMDDLGGFRANTLYMSLLHYLPCFQTH